MTFLASHLGICSKRLPCGLVSLRRVPDTARHWGGGTRWGSTRRGHLREILTLRPSEMVKSGQKVYDLSGTRIPKFGIFGKAATMRYAFVDRVPRPAFPEGTMGVFYYHHEDGRAPESGALRFRICEDVALFEDGKDLLLPDNEKKWEVPLFMLVAGGFYRGFLEKLKEENVVDAPVIDGLYKQRDILPTSGYTRSQFLYEITDPFTISLSLGTVRFWHISHTKTVAHTIRPMTHQLHKHNIVPYTGKIRVRFVPAPVVSIIPDASEYCLQILDILEPVQCVAPNYDFSIPIPRVGELVSRKDMREPFGEFSLWTYNPITRRVLPDYRPLAIKPKTAKSIPKT